MIKIIRFVTAFFLSAQLVAQVPLTAPAEIVSRPLLNSEHIAQEFGSYGIVVLESDAGVRVSNLYSLHDETKICRTFAVVRYPDDINAELVLEHRVILSGQSIGAVFAQRGWAIEKINLYVGVLPVTDRVAGLMSGIPPQPLAVHIYDLVVSRKSTSVLYATIAEVHHPDYLSVTQLEELYGEVAATAAAGSESMLALTRRKMN